ncbi:MAG: competence protein [Bacteroidetes bacterium]|nr:competence protein [Bacteroidota bacterium]
MRFALINEERLEAKPGLRAVCPCCLHAVIAKCGSQRLHHWAHSAQIKCDDWWEPETEWHREWKNNYPGGWQETILVDDNTNEKHIADICTDYGLVIEFQHSHLDPKERIARESFYQNMVWVVDGMRLKRDRDRFFKKEKSFTSIRKGIFQVPKPEECFPQGWLNSSNPVIFDFGTEEKPKELWSKKNYWHDKKNYLYCLFPVRIGGHAILAEISRTAFINSTHDGEWLMRADAFMDVLGQARDFRDNQVAKLRQQYAAVTYITVPRSAFVTKRRQPVSFRKRRRF